MRTRTLPLCPAIIFIWVGLAATAVGQTGTAQVYSDITGSELVSIMEIAGYQTTLNTSDDGTSSITTKMSKLNVAIEFYTCDGESQRCKELQLYTHLLATTPVTAEKVNEWNHKYRFLKVDTDENGQPFTRLDVDLAGGVTAANIASWLRRYDTLANQFTDFIDFWE